MTPPLLELRDISFAYDGKPVLQRANLAMGAGCIGLIGPNGSGKTTLLHAAMGVVTPDSGEILLNGEPVRGKKGLRELRRQVGFVFQNPEDQLFCPTVLEDVAFGPLNLGMPPKQARETASAALARLGLAGFEDRVTHRLSGGEKRLVSLATVLSMSPRGLLLDEPTNDLDPETRIRFIDIVRSLDQAMLIVSHDWDFLDQVADKLYALEHGQAVSKDRGALHRHVHAHPAGELLHEHLDHKRT
ncbi:MAG: cobalt/nickel transport system ATP-binding protein [Desulfovibrionales bacterium]|jgi:cobalt/nickel transport system ATP-binding protein|nr:cobalt/nickel transport system ATP-binding protein [Desulfovibrionales bacterium]